MTNLRCPALLKGRGIGIKALFNMPTSENGGYVPPKMTVLDLLLSKDACAGMSGVSGTSEDFEVRKYEIL